MSPIIIVLINDHATVKGGADEVAISEAAGLAEAGLKVRFLTASAQEVDPRLLRDGITLHAVSNHADGGLIRTLWNYSAARKVRELFCSWAGEPLIVHVHGWTKLLSAAVLREVLDAEFPVVATMHDYFSVCPNGAFYHYGDGCVCDRKPMGIACHIARCDRRSHLHKIWRLVRQHLLHWVVRWPGKLSGIVAVSDFSAKKLKRWIPGNLPLHVLPNPIIIPRQPRVSSEGNDVFLFVGRLTEEKGVLDLAMAARQADVSVCFVGAGDMSDAIQKLNPAATITGWLKRSDVQEWMHKARGLVLSSRWWETQGMVALEALACGVPIIVARDTGAAEWVRHGVNGWTYPAGDIAELSRLLRTVATADISPVSREAYDGYWRAPASRDAHTAGLIKLYQKL